MAQRNYNLVALLLGFALLSPAFGRPHSPPQGDEVPIILPVLVPQLGEAVSAEADTSEHSPTHRVALEGCEDGNPSLCQSWGTQYCDPKWFFQDRNVASDLCKKTCSQCSGSTPNPPSGDYRRQMLDLVNQGRRENGRAPLCLNSKLNAAAQVHSQDMYDHKFLSHDGSDGSTFDQRITRQGYSWRGVAENIAQGREDVAATYDQWKNSAGHWANILGDYDHIGIGKAGDYWTQDFGKSTSESCS